MVLDFATGTNSNDKPLMINQTQIGDSYKDSKVERARSAVQDNSPMRSRFLAQKQALRAPNPARLTADFTNTVISSENALEAPKDSGTRVVSGLAFISMDNNNGNGTGSPSPLLSDNEIAVEDISDNESLQVS